MTIRSGTRAAALPAFILLTTLASGGTATAASCLHEAGERTANRYVEDCLAVSAATRPPCNVENSCALILDEIARSCGQIDDGGPGSRVCRRYK